MSRKYLAVFALTAMVLVGCNNRKAEAPIPTPAPTTATQAEIDSVRNELEKLTGQRTPSPATTNSPVTNKETVLKPESGYQATGYARHGFANNKYTLTVLADLPDLNSGETYQVWLLEQPSQLAQARKVSSLKASKSGYFLDYTSSEDLTKYKYFIVSREKTNDNQIETTVLSGQVE